MDDNGIPWWARVYHLWEADISPEARIVAVNPATQQEFLQAPEQLPGTFRKVFQCRMAPVLDNAGADNAARVTSLVRSIPYGINFDVMRADDVPRGDAAKFYSADSATNTLAVGPRTDTPTNTTNDKHADQYYTADIVKPNEFILLSEANTEDRDKGYWTGGRISMAAITRNWPPVPPAATPPADDPPGNAPIVGRHSTHANVLFADMHVEALRAEFSLDGDGRVKSVIPSVNTNVRLWTLPDD
jgi:prepilin-type processing-associated H-X9-DG protein